MQEKIEYRVNKIIFSNYKGYSKEQVFDFETKRRFQDENTTEKQVFHNKTIKFKKIIGIYGKNSSGKSSLFEIINSWSRNFSRLNIQLDKIDNEKIHNLGHLPNNHEVLCSKYSKNIENINEYSYINNISEPFYVEIAFSTAKINFSYIIYEKIINKKEEIELDLREKIYLNDSMSNHAELIWDSESINFPFAEFLRMNKMFKDKKDKNLFKENMQNPIFGNLLEKMIYIFEKKPKFLSDDKVQDLEIIQNIISRFIANTTFIDPGFKKEETYSPYARFTPNTSFVDMINKKINILYKKEYSEKIIEELLLKMIKVLDSNIHKIEIDKKDKKRSNQIFFKSIINKNNVKNFPEELSLGTLAYIRLMLEFLVNKVMAKNDYDPQYIFIDELGLNWHPGLTELFLKAITNGMMGENIFLVFSSHDSIIANYLETDCVYLINNEFDLKKLSDLENEKGNKLRKNINFSNIYLDDTLDLYSSSPDFSNMEDLDELIHAIERKK